MSQRITGVSASLSSLTATLQFTSAVTVNHSIVVCTCSRFDVVSVFDNKGNTYVKDLRRSFGGGSCSIWRSSNVSTAGATFVVSVTQTSAGTPSQAACLLSAQEIAGDIYLDRLNTVGVDPNGTTSTGPVAGSPPGVTTNVDLEYEAAMFYAGTIPTNVFQGPAGFNSVALSMGGVGGPVANIVDRNTSTVETVLPSWVLETARTWVAILATYAETQTPSGTLVTGAMSTTRPGVLRMPVPGTPWGFLGPPPRWPDIHVAPPPGLPFNRYLQSGIRDLMAPDRDIPRATQKLRNSHNSLVRQGIIQVDSSGHFVIRAGSFTATRSPEVTDDLRTIGAQVGSLWYDSENEQLWMCKDPSVSEADWARISLAEDFIGNPFSGSL